LRVDGNTHDISWISFLLIFSLLCLIFALQREKKKSFQKKKALYKMSIGFAVVNQARKNWAEQKKRKGQFDAVYRKVQKLEGNLQRILEEKKKSEDDLGEARTQYRTAQGQLQRLQQGKSAPALPNLPTWFLDPLTRYLTAEELKNTIPFNSYVLVAYSAYVNSTAQAKQLFQTRGGTYNAFDSAFMNNVLRNRVELLTQFGELSEEDQKDLKPIIDDLKETIMQMRDAYTTAIRLITDENPTTTQAFHSPIAPSLWEIPAASQVASPARNEEAVTTMLQDGWNELLTRVQSESREQKRQRS
jgi:hypothetical protein